jgi:hypothetical protein
MAMLAAVFAGLYLLGNFVAERVAEQFDLVVHVRSEPVIHRMIMTATAIYMALMATPFMPGVEVALSMILVFGVRICFLIYVSTVLALILPYLAGRLVPARYCSRAFGFLGLERAQHLVNLIGPMSGQERLKFLVDETPNRWGPFVLRHRYVALGIALNLPGNILIGGGGGIAMLAGMTGLYSFPAYLLTIIVAVAPLPLAIIVTEKFLT